MVVNCSAFPRVLKTFLIFFFLKQKILSRYSEPYNGCHLSLEYIFCTGWTPALYIAGVDYLV